MGAAAGALHTTAVQVRSVKVPGHASPASHVLAAPDMHLKVHKAETWLRPDHVGSQHSCGLSGKALQALRVLNAGPTVHRMRGLSEKVHMSKHPLLKAVFRGITLSDISL